MYLHAIYIGKSPQYINNTWEKNVDMKCFFKKWRNAVTNKVWHVCLAKFSSPVACNDIGR